MKSLVLVLGAGASNEVNLPVGADLKTRIAERLDIRFENGYHQNSGDEHITYVLKSIAAAADGGWGDINPLLNICWLIRDAMPQALSIDNFIDSHRGDPRIALCGKLAIARCILEAEAGSTLTIDRSNIYNKMNFAGVAGTWYNAFFQLLTENCSVDQIVERLASVAVISFNYDRCFEHYLYHSLQNFYGISPAEAARLLGSLEIHHPYGMVGPLPWMSSGGGIEFGSNPGHQQLREIAGQLRTFTEGTDPAKSDINAIRATVANARRVAFLGFAFHRLNIDLLFPGLPAGTPAQTESVFATAISLSQSDCASIASELSTKALHPRDKVFIRNNLTCAKLFGEFWRSLSLV
jgi:hypothetical protein